jgi:lipopolysaccharide/colanic/teichoic acid biosynthesis glycosyltransferase
LTHTQPERTDARVVDSPAPARSGSARGRDATRLERRIKRLVDVTGALVGLAVLWPALLVIGVLIKLDSKGPVLYRPEVVGLRGKRFTLLKFRSMVEDASAVLRAQPELWEEYRRNLKVKADPRVTRLGKALRKASLDELPQLVNVLRGELSLVGPRVLSEVELARYGEAGEKVLSVVPGLTGLWQVSGRHELSFERRVELDLYYVDHRTLWMDLAILFRTVPAVFTGRGAG